MIDRGVSFRSQLHHSFDGPVFVKYLALGSGEEVYVYTVFRDHEKSMNVLSDKE